MAYSAKKYWTLGASTLAVGLAGMALVFWLNRNHIDPVTVGMVRVALAFIIIGLAMRAVGYRDEVQRQASQKRWFQGSMIGLAAMVPMVVALQTHKLWLDAVVQFLFRHPGTPPLYLSLGVAIPVVFQSASVLLLRLFDKLSQGSQS